MGLLDDMFSKKKEPVKPRAAKIAATKKDQSIKPQNSDSPIKNSFFGSLRRGSGSTSTSTPKATRASTKSTVDPSKTKDHLQIRNRTPDKDKKPWYRSTSSNLLRKDQLKSSTTSLNASSQRSTNIAEIKRKRPLTVNLSSNVTYRRGQNPKLEGQNLPDNLSRTSSITNIDAEQKPGKGAKPRKSSSRDRIDKVGDKKNDKKGVTKNNNKLDSGESPYPSIDSLQEEELVQLRRQLQEMAQEKSNLALQLGEQKGQLNILQKEIQSLKNFQAESNLQLEQLSEENTALRNRLRDVAHSPLSDNEKQQLLFETHHRHHSSAPASIATNLVEEGNGGDITTCPTPDWDKHSSSNVSEVSVACLQDKINQMQETHYSTNEELQATLQELTDLQRQLTELQQDNDRLNEEKTLMFDSLCRQTERLNESRSEVESLKQLLYREKDETGQYESAIEREQKLVELLKSAQEEKQSLVLKLEQINNELQEARAANAEKDERITQLTERVGTLESTLDAKHAEHKLLDQELAQARDQCSGKQIEINRLTDLLDNARTKIVELEQDRAMSDKSELDELLDNARKEKDSLESEVAHLKEQLAIGKNEIEKLRDQVSSLQEECKVTRNNARTTQSDLEYKNEKLQLEKTKLNDQLLEYQEAINELQVQNQCQLEDKRQLSSVLSETQRNLSEAERKNLILENELQELKKIRNEEVEEWEKFQNDLLTSVRVANDFKTEAQQELQQMILENKSYREKERQLRSEIDKLKGGKKVDHEGVESSTKTKPSDKQSNSDMENFLGLSRRSKEKRGKSKDNVEPTPVKEDKTKEKKPDILTKIVKKREKPTSRSKKNKTLSVEEELLLKSLDDWYKNIDKNVPEERLTEEQRVVKKLKALYEDDSLKERPVAHKPKNQLAISKPLLDSVFLNPKLEEIARDPSMPTIEETNSIEHLNDDWLLELRNSPGASVRRANTKSVDLTEDKARDRTSIFSRSKSCDDLYSLDVRRDGPTLYRSAETEDLRKDIPLIQVTRESSILPTDSASNPRYSDFAYTIDTNLRLNQIEEATSEVKLNRNSSVKFETLEHILASIPKGVSEDEFSNEQKFAVRLKRALDEAERKNTLKKKHNSKKVVISKPTVESVGRNSKLRGIMLDPTVQAVRRNSEADHNLELLANNTIRQSKSYQDISFKFNLKLYEDNKSFNSTGSTLGDSYGFNRKISSLEPFSSMEFENEEILTPRSSSNLNTFRESQSEDKENDTSSLNNYYVDSQYNSGTFTDIPSYEPMNTTVDQKEAEDIVETVNENIALSVTRENLSIHIEPEEFIVKPDEDEVDTNYATTITIGEECTTTLDNSIVEEFSDLTYNETLNKKLISKHKINNADTIEENSTKDFEVVSAVPDIIFNLSSSAVGNQKFEDQNQISDAQTSFIDDEELCDAYIKAQLDDEVDTDVPEYDYHAILKENRYGVVSPLNIRLSFKDVVREIKQKYGSEKSVENESDDDSSRKSDEVDGVVSKEFSNLDVEMEEIFNKYLHTPVSKVITQIDDEKIDKDLEEIETVAKALVEQTYTSNFVTILEDEKTPEIPTVTDENVEEIVLIIDDQNDLENKNTTTAYAKACVSHPPKREAINNDTNFDKNDDHTRIKSNSYRSSKDEDTDINILSVNIDKELTILENFEEESQTPEIIGSANENVSVTYPSNPDDVDNDLSEDELAILRSARSIRFSRPLSDFNDNDLEMIERLSALYLPKSSKDLKEFEDLLPKGTDEATKPSLDSLEDISLIEINKDKDKNKLPAFEHIQVYADNYDNVPRDAIKDIDENTEEMYYEEVVYSPYQNVKIIETNQEKVIITAAEESSVQSDDVTDVSAPFLFPGRNKVLETEASKSYERDDKHFETNQDGEELSQISDKITTNKEEVYRTVKNKEDNLENRRRSRTESWSSDETATNLVECKDDKETIDTKLQNSNLEDTNTEEQLLKPVPQRIHCDDNDDVDTVLTKMAAPILYPKRNINALELKDAKQRVVLRNPNYEIVKNKFEHFSKQNTEPGTPKRLSLNPYTNMPQDRRKVKSWAEHFEKRSLDAHSSYEPVYANLKMLNLEKRKSDVTKTNKIPEKKPLPVPRSRNPVKNFDISSDSKDDTFVNETKMSDCKIISENDTENVKQELPETAFGNISEINEPDLPKYREMPDVILEGPPKQLENDDVVKTGVIGVNKSEKFLEMHDGTPDVAPKSAEEDVENLASGAANSFSSIAVAGKFEQLDLTKQLDDVEEVPSINESHLNLFHLETPSYDESYLSLFKSPEEKMYEDISGVRRPVKGYLNFTYLGEASDNESYQEAKRPGIGMEDSLKESDSKPKIIDFVPLDEETQPVFNKATIETNYDTLEREKTFQVLNLAATTGAVRKSVTSTESKKPAGSSSRMSFTAARKVFESLVENNMDKEKNEKSKSKETEGLRHKTSQVDVRTSQSKTKPL